jgi:predicted dehydrogenase
MPGIRLTAEIPVEGDFDIAVIATPPKFHLQYFDTLRRRARDILVEKPITRTLEEAEEFCRMADEDSGSRVYVHFMRRTLSSFDLIRSFRRSGCYGKLQEVRFSEGGPYRWGAVSMGSFSKDLNGGGVLMDTGPHGLDSLHRIFGTLSLVDAAMDAEPGGIEANATLRLLGDGEVPVVFQVSRNRFLCNQCEFRFETAKVRLGVADNRARVECETGTFSVESDPRDAVLSGNAQMMFSAFYQRFLLKRTHAGVSPQESLGTQRIISQAYQESRFEEDPFE